ncbi:hypothetical protein GQ600_17442 [Phytophthora cactorum]|nr:hypothetical protein GQ600_17442 [Phytophthora cactorum]
MRFSVFVVLLVATFLVCCFSFASAENFNGGRRLRAEDGKNGAAKAAVKAVQTSNADEAAIETEILGFAAAKEGAKMSDECMAKISKMLAENAKKNPKSWPRLRKFAKITRQLVVLLSTQGHIGIHDYYDDWYNGNWFDA